MTRLGTHQRRLTTQQDDQHRPGRRPRAATCRAELHAVQGGDGVHQQDRADPAHDHGGDPEVPDAAADDVPRDGHRVPRDGHRPSVSHPLPSPSLPSPSFPPLPSLPEDSATRTGNPAASGTS